MKLLEGIPYALIIMLLKPLPLEKLKQTIWKLELIFH